jgi:hypothetical protein
MDQIAPRVGDVSQETGDEVAGVEAERWFPITGEEPVRWRSQG